MGLFIFPEKKMCETCGETKDRKFFHIQRSNFDCLRNHCNECLDKRRVQLKSEKEKHIQEKNLFVW